MAAVTVEHLLRALRQAGEADDFSPYRHIADIAERYAQEEAEVVRQINSPEFVLVPRELLEYVADLLDAQGILNRRDELRALLKGGGK